MTPHWTLDEVEPQADGSVIVRLSTGHPSYPDQRKNVEVAISEYRLQIIANVLVRFLD